MSILIFIINKKYGIAIAIPFLYLTEYIILKVNTFLFYYILKLKKILNHGGYFYAF